MAVPFIIAGGFGVAALLTRLSTLYGPVTAYSVLAVGFLLVGFVGTAALASKRVRGARTTVVETVAVDNAAPEPPVDLEAIIAAIAALGPTIAPTAGRIALRHWTLLVLLGAVILLVNSDRTRIVSPNPSPAE